jgi:hypothetical protein
MASNYNIHGTDDDNFYYCPRNDCPCHNRGDDIAPTRSIYDDDPHRDAYLRADYHRTDDDAWASVINDIDSAINQYINDYINTAYTDCHDESAS